MRPREHLTDRPCEITAGEQASQYSELLVKQARCRASVAAKPSRAWSKSLVQRFDGESREVGEHAPEGSFVCELRASYVERAAPGHPVGGHDLGLHHSDRFSWSQSPSSTAVVVE